VIYIDESKGICDMRGSNTNFVADISLAVLKIATEYSERTNRTMDAAINTVFDLVRIGVREGLKQFGECGNGSE